MVAAADLTRLLAEGRTYFWALRQVYDDPVRARATLAEVGIDVPTLLALKELEPAIARYPAPVVSRLDGRYLHVPIPPGSSCWFANLVTERGIESGHEILPYEVTWTFAHREAQTITSGCVPLTAYMLHGESETKQTHPGAVLAMGAGTRLTFHAPAEGAFPHAHQYMTNLGVGENRTFYDAVSLLKLQQLDVVGSSEGLPPLADDVHGLTEVTDWSQLVSPRPGRVHQLPSWLRNGWRSREWTRALDYAEGAKRVVVTAPDREPADFLEWGDGVTRCRVNPLIAEASAAITDCVFPPGYHRSQPGNELWTILRGQARLSLTLAPLHAETVVLEVESGCVAVIPGGSRLTVEDASGDLVVRRLAESCAVNAHWRMMEAKLVTDGIDKEFS